MAVRVKIFLVTRIFGNKSIFLFGQKHYLLHCLNFKSERQSLLQNVRIVNRNLLSKNEDALKHLLFYGDSTLTDNTNTFLVNSVIEYITSTKRSNDPLILQSKSNSTRRLLDPKLEFIFDFCIFFRF